MAAFSSSAFSTSAFSASAFDFGSLAAVSGSSGVGPILVFHWMWDVFDIQ